MAAAPHRVCRGRLGEDAIGEHGGMGELASARIVERTTHRSHPRLPVVLAGTDPSDDAHWARRNDAKGSFPWRPVKQGFDDVTFDLISVQYHSLKAGHDYGQYVRDAK